MKNYQWLARVLFGVAIGAFAGLSSAATTTYFHNDLAGSPVAATDSSGQVLWRESYRPYGERLKLEPASVNNSIWFTGRHEDAHTELVYMGARYYDPRVGRFLSVDPIHFLESNIHSFNRYAYANNNPSKFKDSDGRAASAIVVGAGAALLIGGGYQSLSPDQRAAMGKAIQELGKYTLLGQLSNLIFNETSDGSAEASIKPESGKELDPADKSGELSRAGRAQQKHGDRAGSAFDPATGTPSDKNEQGQRTLDSIVNSPDRTFTSRGNRGVDVRESPNGKGARFNGDGDFRAFIEPGGR